MTVAVAPQISSGSGSTHPGSGGSWACSRYPLARGWREAAKRMHRAPVVPWSTAATKGPAPDSSLDPERGIDEGGRRGQGQATPIVRLYTPIAWSTLLAA